MKESWPALRKGTFRAALPTAYLREGRRQLGEGVVGKKESLTALRTSRGGSLDHTRPSSCEPYFADSASDRSEVWF